MMAILLLLRRIPASAWIGIGAAVLVGLLLWRIDYAAYDRGRHSRDGEVAVVKQSLTTALGNTATLQAAINRQNTAIAALADAGAKAQREGRDALQAARKREVAMSGTVARLEAHGRAVAAPGCPASAINRKALDAAL